MSATEIVSPELENAWQAARSTWSDAKLHDVLLGLAAKHEQFAWLAAKYRSAGWANPYDTIAPFRLARVQRAAAMVVLTKPINIEPPRSKLLRGAGAVLVGAMLATVLGLYVTEQRVAQTATATVSRNP